MDVPQSFNTSKLTVPRKFHDDVADHEGLPAVSFRWALSSFVQVTLDDELGLDLLYLLMSKMVRASPSDQKETNAPDKLTVQIHNQFE